MINIPSYNEDPSYRYKMPKLATKIEGRGNGIKTNLVNMAAVASAIKSPPDYVTKFFGCELGAQSRWEASTEKSIVNGAHEQPEMQKLLDKYLEKYVLCYKCKLPELDMAVKKGMICAKCAACGWSGDLDNVHKVSTYIVGHPPDGSHGQSASAASKKDRKKAKAPEVDVPTDGLVVGFTSDEDEEAEGKPLSRSSSAEDKEKKAKKEKKEKKSKEGKEAKEGKSKKEKKVKKEKKDDKKDPDEKNTDSFSDDYPEDK